MSVNTQIGRAVLDALDELPQYKPALPAIDGVIVLNDRVQMVPVIKGTNVDQMVAVARWAAAFDAPVVLDMRPVPRLLTHVRLVGDIDATVWVTVHDRDKVELERRGVAVPPDGKVCHEVPEKVLAALGAAPPPPAVPVEALRVDGGQIDTTPAVAHA